MKKKITFIVVAAGIGKRMQLGYPKQFLLLDGKPIFIHTLEKISENSYVTDIVLVTNEDMISEVEKICTKYKIKKITKIVAGGSERQESVYNGLKIIKNDDTIYSDVVAIHDVVRPFFDEATIGSAYNILTSKNNDAEKIDGVILSVAPKDTIKQVDEDGNIITTLERKSLVCVQTPQFFLTDKIIKAHEVAITENFLGTDDSSLVERNSGRVKVIEGSYGNLKITTKEDLYFLKNI